MGTGATQARRGTESAAAASSSRGQATAASVRDGHRRLSGPDAQRVEGVGSGHDRENTKVEAVVPPTRVDDSGLHIEGAWEEVKRYATARRIFMGAGIGGRASQGNASRERFLAEEAVLLRRLDDSRASRDHPRPVPRECGQRAAAVPMPDTMFVAWKDQAQSNVLEKDALCRQGCVGRAETDAGKCSSVVGNRGPSDGFVVEGRGGGAVERWAEVERLQRSLLMLLDEVEGRRDVLAAKEKSRMKLRGRRDSGPRGVDGRTDEDRGGAAGSTRDFEDWYCWNKVVAVVMIKSMVLVLLQGGGGCGGTPMAFWFLEKS